jgi:hypothetical protein
MHVKEDALMSSCFLQVLIRILGNEVVGTYMAMILMGTPLHTRKFECIGTAVSLSSQGHPNSQMSQPVFFQFCESPGVATVTWMIQLTWRSSPGILS